jgi:hypothetical protein
MCLKKHILSSVSVIWSVQSMIQVTLVYAAAYIDINEPHYISSIVLIIKLLWCSGVFLCKLQDRQLFEKCNDLCRTHTFIVVFITP